MTGHSEVIDMPDKPEPGSYPLARWVSTDKRPSSDRRIAGEMPTYRDLSPEVCLPKNECRRFFRFARGNLAVCLRTSFVVVFPRLRVAFEGPEEATHETGCCDFCPDVGGTTGFTGLHCGDLREPLFAFRAGYHDHDGADGSCWGAYFADSSSGRWSPRRDHLRRSEGSSGVLPSLCCYQAL